GVGLDHAAPQQLEFVRQRSAAGPAAQAVGGEEGDDEERRGDDDRGRLDPPGDAGFEAEPQQQYAERHIGERKGDHGGGQGGPDPGRRTLRVSWISDLARWLMSVMSPLSATRKRTAVSSWPE